MPRAYRVGSTIDGDLVLQSVSLRTASIGPAAGASVVLEMPAAADRATGTLPPRHRWRRRAAAAVDAAPAVPPVRRRARMPPRRPAGAAGSMPAASVAEPSARAARLAARSPAAVDDAVTRTRPSRRPGRLGSSTGWSGPDPRPRPLR
jgi:hypothetical protein